MKTAHLTKSTLMTVAALAFASAFAQAPAKATEAKPAAKAAEAKPAVTEAKAKPADAAAPSGFKSCDELKASVAEKLEAKGVKNYTLDIVATADVKDGKVVGSCGGGTKKIVYTRG